MTTNEERYFMTTEQAKSLADQIEVLTSQPPFKSGSLLHILKCERHPWPAHERAQLLHTLVDMLVTHGLQEDRELNALGIEIEDAIDLINRRASL